mmetsp:Transcript_14691/g.34063  ORF Transcript_14691/g.34063 Transcript_14691/m.34063 type:complete len:89 (-) Transcript_14691:235-501(-)
MKFAAVLSVRPKSDWYFAKVNSKSGWVQCKAEARVLKDWEKALGCRDAAVSESSREAVESWPSWLAERPPLLPAGAISPFMSSSSSTS